jgi:uncharacterized membrane protein
MHPTHTNPMAHSLRPNPMMYGHLLAFSIVHCVIALVVLAGFVFFLVTAWRFMRAHEQIACTLKDVAVIPKPKEIEPKE